MHTESREEGFLPLSLYVFPPVTLRLRCRYSRVHGSGRRDGKCNQRPSQAGLSLASPPSFFSLPTFARVHQRRRLEKRSKTLPLTDKQRDAKGNPERKHLSLSLSRSRVASIAKRDECKLLSALSWQESRGEASEREEDRIDLPVLSLAHPLLSSEPPSGGGDASYE